MTEIIEKIADETSYEEAYKNKVKPEIVSPNYEYYALTDIDLIKDIREMNEFSALVNRKLWKQSEYVENRVSNFRTKLYNHIPKNTHLKNKWKPSKYTTFQ